MRLAAPVRTSAAFERRLARRMLDKVLHAGIKIDLEAPVDGLFGRADGVCRTAYVTLDPAARRRVDLLGCHDLVHQAALQGFRGRDEAPGEDDVLGPGG